MPHLLDKNLENVIENFLRIFRAFCALRHRARSGYMKLIPRKDGEDVRVRAPA